MVKPTPSICVSSATMKSWHSRVTATEIVAMKRSSGEEGASWKDMDTDGKMKYFTLERPEARKNLADASREKQEGIQGQWQQESAFKKVLEQVKRGADADCGPQMMRRGYLAMKNASREDLKEGYRKEGKSCQWTFGTIREAYEKVATGHVARNFDEKHRLPAADHRASRWNERSHFVVCLPTLQLLLCGGLHLVGLDWTWRKEVLRLVVRSLWRKICMESAEQDTGGAARYQCQ